MIGIAALAMLALTQDRMPAVDDLFAEYDAETRQLALAWTAPDAGGGEAAASYELRYRAERPFAENGTDFYGDDSMELPSATPAGPAQPGDPEERVVTLQLDAVTYIGILYIAGNGDKSLIGNSNPVGGEEVPLPPDPVASPRAGETTASSIELAWDLTPPGVAAIRVRYLTGGGAPRWTDPSTPVGRRVTVSGLAASTTYQLWIRSLNDDGLESGDSAVVVAATRAATVAEAGEGRDPLCAARGTAPILCAIAALALVPFLRR